MQVVQTAAEPPNQGRISFAISGCTWKSRKALSTMVAPNSAVGTRLDDCMQFFRISYGGATSRRIAAGALSQRLRRHLRRIEGLPDLPSSSLRALVEDAYGERRSR